MPAFISGEPMNQSSSKKMGGIATQMAPIGGWFLLVYALASFKQAVVTSDPFLANGTMSAPDHSAKDSAKITSTWTDGRKVEP